ncbi:hypothetical protein HYU11_01925 [Candidatus Woesearchaeota archaeon]|nr:hypothetical protein [Candidatus Woesearchaeota archaeon]
MPEGFSGWEGYCLKTNIQPVDGYPFDATVYLSLKTVVIPDEYGGLPVLFNYTGRVNAQEIAEAEKGFTPEVGQKTIDSILEKAA